MGESKAAASSDAETYPSQKTTHEVAFLGPSARLAPVSWRVSTPQQSVVLRKLGERAVNPVSFRSFLRIVSGFFLFVLFFSLCV